MQPERLVQGPPWPMVFSLSAMLLVLLSFASVVDAAEKPAGSVNTIAHAVNAAESANMAKEAATVAKDAAEHSQFVAKEASAALRYTQDALRQAGVEPTEVDSVGRAAADIESEAGLSPPSTGSQGKVDYGHLEYELERLEHEYNGAEVRNGFDAGKEGLDRLARQKAGVSANGTDPIEIDTDVVPYPNSVEPFGHEGAARELTEASVRESDGMIDQIERAQAIEGKRAVYRSLTKLRGATIASYDGIAKAHLKNVEDYAAAHKWRKEHVVHHLAAEEADVEAWAFPNKAKGGFGNAPAPASASAPFSSEGAAAPATAPASLQ